MQKVSTITRSLMLISALLVVTVSLGACGTETGVVTGHVLLFGPVPNFPPKAGPTARFTTTVEARYEGQIRAHQLVLPGHQFDFALPSGTYTLDVVGLHGCQTPLKIGAGHTTHVDVRCVEP